MKEKALLRALLSCSVLSGMAACGQKGPLYLPDKGGTVVTKPAGNPTQQPPADKPASDKTR